jgi:hypothetical protein
MRATTLADRQVKRRHRITVIRANAGIRRCQITRSVAHLAAGIASGEIAWIR